MNVFRRLHSLARKAQQRQVSEAHISLLGDQRVGKTAFLDQLLFASTARCYMPTALDAYTAHSVLELTCTLLSKERKIKRVSFSFYDTSGTLFLSV
jgi:GTPase SAR1 family protein